MKCENCKFEIVAEKPLVWISKDLSLSGFCSKECLAEYNTSKVLQKLPIEKESE